MILYNDYDDDDNNNNKNDQIIVVIGTVSEDIIIVNVAGISLTFEVVVCAQVSQFQVSSNTEISLYVSKSDFLFLSERRDSIASVDCAQRACIAPCSTIMSA